MKKQDTAKGRKLYQKPQVNQVKLMVEEAVLGVCKVSSEQAFGLNQCDTFGAPCKEPGT